MSDLTIFLFAAIILILCLLLNWHQKRLEIWQKIGLTIGIIMGIITLFTLVLGLSLGLPLLIRIAIGVGTCVILSAVILSHYGHLCQPKREEKERTFEIEGLNRTPIETALTNYGENPQMFVGNIWTVRIHNDLSKSVSDCRAELHIFTDGRDRGDILPLRWRGHGELPTTTNSVGRLETREQFRNSLPFSYIGDLYVSGIDSVTIPADGRNEILFSFTLSESDSIFIISLTSKYMLEERDMPSITFLIANLNRIMFLIRFHCGQDTYEKTYRLDGGSWNEVSLVDVGEL
jgi:hypothetical protein